MEPSPLVSIEQAENAGRLVEVAKVKDVKRLMSMFPLWSTFFVYSLVGATANTFFYEQANVMDDHLGKKSHVPLVIFVIIKTFTSFVVSHICELLKSAVGSTRRPPLCRTTFGMLCSFLCCLVAWRVEKYRHDDMEIRVDEDNVEFNVNEMSVF